MVTSDDALTRQLASTDLFHGVSRRTLERIERNGELLSFAPGAFVTEEGAKTTGLAAFGPRGAYFHLVLEGSGEVRREGATIGEVGPGSYFGELSLIDGEPRSADVVAGPEGLRTFALDKWQFETLLEEHPEVAIPMLKVMIARLRTAEARH